MCMCCRSGGGGMHLPRVARPVGGTSHERCVRHLGPPYRPSRKAVTRWSRHIVLVQGLFGLRRHALLFPPPRLPPVARAARTFNERPDHQAVELEHRSPATAARTRSGDGSSNSSSSSTAAPAAGAVDGGGSARRRAVQVRGTPEPPTQTHTRRAPPPAPPAPCLPGQREALEDLWVGEGPVGHAVLGSLPGRPRQRQRPVRGVSGGSGGRAGGPAARQREPPPPYLEMAEGARAVHDDGVAQPRA